MSLSRVHGLPYELMLRIVGFFDLKDLRVFLMTSKHSYQQKLQLMAIVFSSSWSVHRLVASNRVPMLTKMKVLGMTRCDGGKGLLMIRTFDDASHVLMWSACHGFVDTIERVAPYCRREDLNIALALACANGVASAVRTLLEVRKVPLQWGFLRLDWKDSDGVLYAFYFSLASDSRCRAGSDG